jgi:hypothetical protein
LWASEFSGPALYFFVLRTIVIQINFFDKYEFIGKKRRNLFAVCEQICMIYFLSSATQHLLAGLLLLSSIVPWHRENNVI